MPVTQVPTVTGKVKIRPKRPNFRRFLFIRMLRSLLPLRSLNPFYFSSRRFTSTFIMSEITHPTIQGMFYPLY
jgi:hypothetical protein